MSFKLDGDLDVMSGTPWPNSVSSISVRVYYNNGTGSYSNAQVVESGKGLYSGVVCDVDGDKDLDIIVQDRYSNRSKPYVDENRLDSVSPARTQPLTTLHNNVTVIIMLLFEE